VKEVLGEGKKEVSTFTPGMILTISLESYPVEKREPIELFHRLYAPISAHTTSAKGRDCKSCHLDPLAIGYGRGKLVFHKESGKWEFISRFAANLNDGLPEDAWTGFLKQRDDISATRYHMRPFSLEEQQSILLVGTCLTCHPGESEIMVQSLTDFKEVVLRRSEKCILPSWE
jgi:hypothetical protein